jgi:hypothetical protein
MKYVIEKNIEMPANQGAGAPFKYPWPDMKVGDSILGSESAYRSGIAYGKRHGIEFTSRKEGGKLRIWRIA